MTSGCSRHIALIFLTNDPSELLAARLGGTVS
jgi:hypothetical protein